MAVSFFGTFLLQGIGFTESGAAIANCFASFSGLLGNIVGTLTIDKVSLLKDENCKCKNYFRLGGEN